MQKTESNQTTQHTVAAKPTSTQGGVAGFFRQMFDLPAGWHKRNDIAKNNFDLGIQQFRLGNTADAVFRFKIATWLNPNHAPSWYWLGRSYVSEGKSALAVKALNKATKLKPGEEHINYIMALALGDKAPERLLPKRVPPDMIKEYFNIVAPDYNYTVKAEARTEHDQLAKAVKEAVQEGRVDHVVLDLGVGTGLCGAQLRDIASYITGVDLSAAMLEQAKMLRNKNEQGIYDKLINREAMDFINDVTDQSYDIVLTSGVTHYIGDLEPLFQQLNRVLKPDGAFAMTAHAAAKGPYHFDSKREWFTYTREYLEECASKAGFKQADVKEIKISPGQEGWLGIFTK